MVTCYTTNASQFTICKVKLSLYPCGWAGDKSSCNMHAVNVNSGLSSIAFTTHPDNKVHGANVGPIWGRQDPGGPHVGPMNFAIWESGIAAIAIQAWHLSYWWTSLQIHCLNHWSKRMLNNIHLSMHISEHTFEMCISVMIIRLQPMP